MRKWIIALIGLAISQTGLPAQDLAPDSMAGSLLTVAVTGGSAPFAASGGYKLFTSAAGTNYVVLGRAGAGFGSGTYNYTRTATNTAVLTFLDSQAGPGTSMTLSFTSPHAGKLLLAGTTGSQTGTFTSTNYLTVNPPDLFLPGLTNGQFQSYLGGQNGFIYSVETSSNLASWTTWTNVTLSDLTAALDIESVGGPRYFRARLQSTAFAPDSLTNKAFNQTIMDGMAPLPTNGICQWMADTNGNGYQIIGGPGTMNSSGTYSYTKTGPESGVISYSDSLAGNVNEQLVFTSPDSGYFYATNVSGVESGTFSMADGATFFLGNVHFVPDTARASSVYFAADGTSASLSVTNAAGWVWTLYCPTNALLTPRTITMTPFASVDSSDALFPVSAGVQLGPDGLQFSDGVTLTVTPPAPLGAYASLMMAGNDGSDIYFVQDTNQAGSYSTTLFHFSSAEVSDPTAQRLQEIQNRIALVKAAYRAALDEVKALEHSTDVPPVPPDYDWKCHADTNAEVEIDAYVKNVFAKESAAIRQLLSVTRCLVLLTSDASYGPPALNAARELIETSMYRKVDWLFSHYSGNPLKLTAVSRVALSVGRQDELLGGSGRPDWLTELAAWAARARDYYFDKLRNGNDYSLFSVVITLEHDAELFGGPADNQLRTELVKAMTFKLSMDITYYYPAGAGEIEAKGDMTMTPSALLDPFNGSGTVSGVPSQVSGCTVVQDSYTVNALLDRWDLCPTNGTEQSTMDIIFEPGLVESADGTWTCPGGIAHTTTPLQASAAAAWVQTNAGQYIATDGRSYSGYFFTVPVHNGDAQAVDQTIVGQVDGGTGGQVTLHLVLLHTPQ